MSYDLVRGLLAVFKLGLQVRRFRTWRREVRNEREAQEAAEYAEFRKEMMNLVIENSIKARIAEGYTENQALEWLEVYVTEHAQELEAQMQKWWENGQLSWRLTKKSRDE